VTGVQTCALPISGYFMAFVATDIEGKNYLKVEKV
jgi:hypothetical protein